MANRDPRLLEQYRAAQQRIKGLQPGTPAFQRAAQRIEQIGSRYGLNWQQWVPGAERKNRGPKDPYTQQPEPPFQKLKPEARDMELDESAAEYIRGMMQRSQPFQPGSFQEQMDAAYNNVYGQFQRRNEPEFRRQEQAFYQMAAERGLDPNSEAYKTLYKQQVTDPQIFARQEAQSAALTASQGVQQQGFGQAYQTALAPGEQAAQFAPYWAQQQKQRADLEALRKDYEYKMKLQQQADAAALQRSRISAAGSGQQDTSVYDKWIEQQIAQGYGGGSSPNYTNSFIQGLGAGGGQAVVGYLTPPRR
jgi:hypothetical protein